MYKQSSALVVDKDKPEYVAYFNRNEDSDGRENKGVKVDNVLKASSRRT